MAISNNRDTKEFDKFGGETRDTTYVRTANFNQLVTENYDYIDCDYTDGNLTQVIYKTGGSGGTTVATLTITYTVDNCIDTVTKS